MWRSPSTSSRTANGNRSRPSAAALRQRRPPPPRKSRATRKAAPAGAVFCAQVCKIHLVETFIQQLINGLTLGSIYALVALGYTMVYGILGLINFAHGEVVMIGALVALAVCKALLASALPPALILLIGFCVAAIVCMALGWSIE